MWEVPPSKRRSVGKRVAAVLLALLAAPLVWVVLAPFLYWRAAGEFLDYRPTEPSRLYGRAAGDEPAPLLATYYGPQKRERRTVRLERLPESLVQAVLAAEDDAFFVHRGLSFTSILRAAWVNMAAGEIRQGGSTITQQLARNLYLTRERTWGRKHREALLSLALEMRFSKRRILEAYLNEAYFGQRGAQLVGVGAAAHAYFGKSAEQLTLAESALLAGMIRSPGDYAPTEHPERARARRNLVLERLAKLGWIDRPTAAAAAASPIALAADHEPSPQAFGYFADLAAGEARRRFGIENLADAGYTLHSTLVVADQRHAETAIAAGLAGLARGGRGAAPQAALVSIDPADGSILAYVGGRDYRESPFDRAGNARRQAGSAFKPVVFAAALAAGSGPADLLLDSPIVVKLQGSEWRPRNDDGGFHGPVSLRAALERSLNIPTVRLALGAGLESISTLAARLGCTSPPADGPSLALGAIDVTPLELAGVYATLAAGGMRRAPHALRDVVDGNGVELRELASEAPERALDEDTAFLVTSLLQGVIDHGTGHGVRRRGLKDPLAGKTGTSDGGRDAWFAGYSAQRAAVVWVGHDDNRPSELSGSKAALPIWADFMGAVRPPEGHAAPEPPPGVVREEIDPETGHLATAHCPRRQGEYFYLSRAPLFACPLHSAPFGIDEAVAANYFPPSPPAPAAGESVIFLGDGSAGTLSWMALKAPRGRAPAEPPRRETTPYVLFANSQSPE